MRSFRHRGIDRFRDKSNTRARALAAAVEPASTPHFPHPRMSGAFDTRFTLFTLTRDDGADIN